MVDVLSRKCISLWPRHKNNLPQTEPFYCKRLRIWKPAVVETEWCHGSLFLGESEAVVEVSAFRLGEVLKVEKYHQCQAENGTLTGASTVFIDDWSQIPYFPWRLSGFETLLDSHIPVVFGWFVNLTSTASTCLCSKSLKLRVVLSYAFPKPTSHCPDSPATMIFAKAASARGRGAFFFWAMMGWSCCGIE